MYIFSVYIILYMRLIYNILYMRLFDTKVIHQNAMDASD